MFSDSIDKEVALEAFENNVGIKANCLKKITEC